MQPTHGARALQAMSDALDDSSEAMQFAAPAIHRLGYELDRRIWMRRRQLREDLDRQNTLPIPLRILIAAWWPARWLPDIYIGDGSDR
jgi:hypothetical protein